jgi:hypothetical protein
MNAVFMTNRLLFFIKNPVAGKVKTRLAADVGHQQALAIYRRLLAHTRRQCEALEAERRLYYSDFVDAHDEWPEALFQKFVQRGDDLGRRMANAFEEALQTPAKAVIIGSDCPGMDTALLQEAFLALEEYDFVLGPAHDGGYYLLGMRHFRPEVFAGINWSTEEVLPATLAHMAKLGASCAMLPTLTDVDHLADWEQWAGQIA